jgi:hypothetical protein
MIPVKDTRYAPAYSTLHYSTARLVGSAFFASANVTGQPGVTASVTLPAFLSTTNAGPAFVPFGVNVVACINSSFPCHGNGKPPVRSTAGFGGPVLG